MQEVDTAFYLWNPFKGKRTTIFYPKGMKGKGWATMAGAFSSFLDSPVAPKVKRR